MAWRSGRMISTSPVLLGGALAIGAATTSSPPDSGEVSPASSGPGAAGGIRRCGIREQMEKVALAAIAILVALVRLVLSNSARRSTSATSASSRSRCCSARFSVALARLPRR
jgi:hypothetical protein